MKITSLKLTNFRNWSEISFSFSDRVLIYGPNARGKTNILEALYMVATTRSFRGKDAELVRSGQEFTKIEAVIDNDKEIQAEVIIKKGEGSKGEKEYRLNDKKRASIDFVGEFSAVVFSPEDLLLISGPPELKRRYLSFTIGQKDREYLFNLLNYKKILRQRNELLKMADRGRVLEEIDVWDENLAEYGQKIIDDRKKFEAFVNERFNKYYKELSADQKEVKFVYEPTLWGEDLITSLFNSREKDMAERNTGVGPHRDGWHIEIEGKNATSVASRGEYRTLILALKLAERDFLTKNGQPPVILLDDVFSELDETRRKYLVSAFAGSQLVITTTDLDHLNQEYQADTQLINIEKLTGSTIEPVIIEPEEVVEPLF